MNQSTVNFIVKTLGADEAAREFAKIERAAQKAGTTVKKYLATGAGEQKLLALQTRAATEKVKAQTDATNKAADATDRASGSQKRYFGHIAKTTVMSALINKLFLEMVDVSGQAIQQVDLMNNFPATMASMGESTRDASEAMNALRSYVGQIGGNLGDATSMVTRFTGATRDVKAATAIFVGLNNALIAGDSSMEEQRQAAIQFAQALERGKPDMREWRTLTQNMSFQLQQVATSMGYVNANALGEALTSGEESMAAFTTALTKLATGTEDIAAQARARMTGVQFSFNVLKNTMVQGLAAILQQIGRENIVSFFTFLTQVVQVLTSVVLKLVSALITLFNFFAKLFGLPSIKLKNDMAGVATATGDGADKAGDLADGIGAAGDEAAKLNKSLASFDKMNVLPDKTSSSGKTSDTGGTGTSFDSGQIEELGNLFGEIGSNLENVSKWAKIFAGVIAGIVGIKFAQGIIDQIAGIAKSFQTAKTGISNFATAINKLPTSISNEFGKVKTLILGTTDDAGKAVGGLKGVFANLGGFLTNPWILLIVAITAVVEALVWLYNTNEDFKKGFDSVWNGFAVIVNDVAKTIGDVFGKTIKWIGDEIAKIPAPFKKAFKVIGDAIKPVIDWFADLANKLGIVGPPMEVLGKVVGAVAVGLAVLVGVWTLWNAALIVFNVIGGIAAGIFAILTSPITLVVLAIVALIAAIVFLISNWSKVTAIATTVWNGIVAVWSNVATWFQTTVIQPISDFFTGLWNGIVAGVTAVWTWLTTTWSNIIAVLAGPFQLAWQIISSIFILLVAILAITIKTIFNILSTIGSWIWDNVITPVATFFTNLWNGVVDAVVVMWDGIVEIFSTVGTWIYNNVIKPVADFFVALWNGIIAAAKWWWNGLMNVLLPIFGWINTNVIQPIAKFFKQLWVDVTGFVTGFINNAMKGLGVVGDWIKLNVINPIANMFNGLWNGITSGVNALVSGIKSVFGTITGFVKTPINGIIDSINGVIKGINNIKVPDWVPGIGGSSSNFPRIPRLARGGVVTQPTAAVIGESGKEAIVPLENNLEWIDKLASKINTSAGENSQPIQLVVQIGEERIASQIINLINEKTHMSGRNTIYV